MAAFNMTYARTLDIIKSMDEYQRSAFFYAAEEIQKGRDYDPKHKIRVKFLGKAKRFRDIYDTYNDEQQDMFIYITSRLIAQIQLNKADKFVKLGDDDDGSDGAAPSEGTKE